MRTLTLRELNRATLARQLLLARSALPIPDALDQVGGLQSQALAAPFVGLWTRLQDFEKQHLVNSINDHTVIKATMMRATLHLASAAEYLRIRATLQPALTRGWKAVIKGREADFNLDAVLALGRQFIAETPRSFAEISEMLTAALPHYDVGAMRYAIRTHLPLVMVPVAGGWSYPGNPKFTLAETWLGKSPDPAEDFRGLVHRYLSAFGPASVTDMQTWSGLASLKSAFDQLKPELTVYRDAGKRELFDLPTLSIPDESTPALVRFLPEYDNILLSHSNRTRIIAEEHRPAVFLAALRVRSTILIDGFVGGVWSVEKVKSEATLLIEPFAPPSAEQRRALTEDGEKLVRLMEPTAKSFAVRVAE